MEIFIEKIEEYWWKVTEAKIFDKMRQQYLVRGLMVDL